MGRYFFSYKADYEDDLSGQPFPTDEEMRLFLGEYRNEFAKHSDWNYLADPDNSMQQLLKEAKVFLLHGYLAYIWVMLFKIITNPGNEYNEFNLICVYHGFEFYQKAVRHLLSEGFLSK